MILKINFREWYVLTEIYSSKCNIGCDESLLSITSWILKVLVKAVFNTIYGTGEFASKQYIVNFF